MFQSVIFEGEDSHFVQRQLNEFLEGLDPSKHQIISVTQTQSPNGSTGGFTLTLTLIYK